MLSMDSLFPLNNQGSDLQHLEADKKLAMSHFMFMLGIHGYAHLNDTKTQLSSIEKDSSTIMLCAFSHSIYRSTIKRIQLYNHRRKSKQK